MEQIGISIPTILFQILNFFILMYFLNKFLYAPLMAMLEKRRQRVDEIKLNEERLNNRIKNLEAEKAILIKQAKDEAKEILKKANDSSRQIIEKMERSARKSADEIIEKAKVQAEAQLAAAKKDLENEISKAAIAISENLIDTELSESQKNYILQNSIKILNNNE